MAENIDSWSDDETGLIVDELDARSFLELADLLQVGIPAERKRFAAVALDEMMLAYGLELETVRDMPEEFLDREERVLRWEASTNAYVERLILAAKLVEKSDDVKVLVQVGGSVMLVVADIAVIVSAPRLAEQEALEHRIVEMLCPDISCAMLFDQTLFGAQRVRQRGKWETTSGGKLSYRTAEGWVCEFSSPEQNDLKAQICGRLASEVQQLAQKIKTLRKQKRVIDWDGVAINNNAWSSLHQLRINANQSISMWLPMLDAGDRSLRHWLDVVRRTVEGDVGSHPLLIPDDYLQTVRLQQ